MSDYDVRIIELTDELSPEAKAWAQASRIGFHAPRATPHQLELWWKQVHLGNQRLRAAYPAQETYLPRHFPVATFSSLDKSINVGAKRLVPANFITDVTVLATHRRRGILRRLMTTDLSEARDRGAVFAALTASEATIYGRFGFGVANRIQTAELRTEGTRLQLRDRIPERVEVADPTDIADVIKQIFTEFHRTHRGSHDRTDMWELALTGKIDWDKDEPDRNARAALHFSESGEPDGYLVYRVGDKEDAPLTVNEVVALNPTAELGLWQFVGDLDLVAKIVVKNFLPSSPLRYALADSRALTVTRDDDLVWTRVLDPIRALTERGYDHDGQVRLAITDPMGFAEGCFDVSVEGGRASVSPSSDDAEVTIDVEALSSVYFGATSALTLQAAGRIDGDSDAVVRFADLMHTHLPPDNLSFF